MTDILERLRYMADAGVPVISTKLMREAADEIERLRAENERLVVELNKYELAALQARIAQRKRDD